MENRRKRADLILMWKFTNGDVYIKFKHPPVLRPVESKCRGHSLTLIHPSDRPPKTKLRTNFFTERIVRLWNGLPESIVSASSLSNFKGRLDTVVVNKIYLYVTVINRMVSVFLYLNSLDLQPFLLQRYFILFYFISLHFNVSVFRRYIYICIYF